MPGRRGFTLVEILVVMVMMLLVGTALTRILVNSMRVSRAQMVTADMQANVRMAGLVLPLELRELGYDSNIYNLDPVAAVTSDIETIGTNSIVVRASRGLSTTCGVFNVETNPGTIRIRRPVMGVRQPELTDGFQMYVENDPNTGVDDQWVNLTVTSINLNGVCTLGGDPAIMLQIDGSPPVGPNPGEVLTNANPRIGGPVRWFERMDFGRFPDADGLIYLGARSLSKGEANYSAVAGPLDPASGLLFSYYNKNGALLTPGVHPPVDVRTVQVQLTGRTSSQVAMAGTRLANRGMITATRVALRNTLKH